MDEFDQSYPNEAYLSYNPGHHNEYYNIIESDTIKRDVDSSDLLQNLIGSSIHTIVYNKIINPVLIGCKNNTTSNRNDNNDSTNLLPDEMYLSPYDPTSYYKYYRISNKYPSSVDHVGSMNKEIMRQYASQCKRCKEYSIYITFHQVRSNDESSTVYSECNNENCKERIKLN